MFTANQVLRKESFYFRFTALMKWFEDLIRIEQPTLVRSEVEDKGDVEEAMVSLLRPVIFLVTALNI